LTRLVVFDLDGTLVDSARQIVASMRAGYAAVNRSPPGDAAILSIVGLSLPLAVERLSPGFGAEERDRIVAAYRAAFLADPQAPPLYPGAAASLMELSRRPDVTLAVATGKTRRGLVKVLDQHGLQPLFGSLHGGDEHPSKPDPAMLRAAMAAAGVGPARTVMVGDSLFDIQMAQAAGVRSVGVSWGYYPPAELRDAGASAILDRFSDLSAAIAVSRGDAA
jgi:phosphoglycolate phosphatase